jgi:hypothetical protein
MPIGDIALAREVQMFIKEEVAAGTLIEPVATDMVLVTGIPNIGQEREQFPDEQKRNTRSMLAPIAGRYLAGSWDFETYIKPNGTAGQVPAEDVLMEGLLGAKATDGTSVSYSPAAVTVTKKSYSIWFKDGHTVYMCSGCAVGRATFRITGREPGKISWSGGLMKRLHTGADTLGSDISDTTSTEITPSDIKLFSVGSIFTIDSERMKVGTVGASTLTVTRGYGGTTPATHSSGADMTPWLPTGTESGTIVHGRLGICTLDGSNYNILESEVTIDDNVKYYEDEKNEQDYATEFGTPESRTVESRFSVYFRKSDAARLQDNIDFNTLAFTIPIGNVAGSICTIYLNQAKIQSPTISGDAERIQEVRVSPFATTAYDNEIYVIYH